MQASSPAEVQDMNVTAQSIARHCGFANDPSDPDVRSEERRLRDLSRQVCLSEELPGDRTKRLDEYQLGVLQTWPPSQAEVVYR
jgi:hypothetical protein